MSIAIWNHHKTWMTNFSEQKFSVKIKFLHLQESNPNYDLWLSETPNEINSFDVNMTGSKLVTGGKDATLRLYDLRTGKVSISQFGDLRYNNERN